MKFLRGEIKMRIGTRAEAIAAGENKYYTGEPCKHGHLSQRYVQSGACEACLRNNNTKDAGRATEERQQENAAVQSAGAARKLALEQLIPVKLRLYPRNLPMMRQIAGSALHGRCEALTEADADTRKPGTRGESGTLLYVFRCYPEDEKLLVGISKEMTEDKSLDMVAERTRIHGAVEGQIERMAARNNGEPEFVIGKG